MIDADGCIGRGNGSPKDGSAYVRRTIGRPLVDSGCEISYRDLLAQRQYPRALSPVFLEIELDGPGGTCATGYGQQIQIDRAGLTDGGCRIKLAGIEAQSQILRILAGKGGSGNCPNDLCNRERGEISCNLNMVVWAVRATEANIVRLRSVTANRRFIEYLLPH